MNYCPFCKQETIPATKDNGWRKMDGQLCSSCRMFWESSDSLENLEKVAEEGEKTFFSQIGSNFSRAMNFNFVLA
jgi:hypothetical protein